MLRWVLVLSLAVGLTGCASQPSGSAGDTIQNYLQARVNKNVDEMIALSCAAWEADARTEAASFASMNAALDGVACTDAGTDGDAALVTCSGKIVTTYNAEQRDWPLEAFTFQVVAEDGEWRMCGYK